MDTLGILDLVIGLFFIYFVLSVVCTAIVEGVAQVRSLRSKDLEEWIKASMGGWASQFLQHGLIQGLGKKGKAPDYIPSRLFAATLLDLLARSRGEKAYDFNGLFDALQQAKEPKGDTPASGGAEASAQATGAKSRSADSAPSGGSGFEDLKRFLLQAMEESGGNLSLLKKRLEDWYNDAMESVTGTYKKRARKITFWAAIFVAGLSNADTIALSIYLKDNPKTAARLVAAAEQTVQDSLLYRESIQRLEAIQQRLDTTSADSLLGIPQTVALLRQNAQRAGQLYESLESHGLPLGWSKVSLPARAEGQTKSGNNPPWGLWIFQKIIGLGLTALALTLGAPFWFDMINKLVNIRSAGKKPEAGEEEKGKSEK
ncbi:MAG: hypothetical protein IPN20_00145 [Haliscomenobacter sp.]|nr:hypothetical protein [Haliscomenobacter sp.]